MFNNTNPATNGESLFYNDKIKPHSEIIFDVGIGVDGTIFRDFLNEVHYFDPCPEYIELLKQTPTNNKKPYYNSFGLSDTTDTLKWYKSCDSFVDRTGSSITCDEHQLLLVKRADEYIAENCIKQIDFLKIDVEGFELNVLKGFGNKIKSIKYIQFEYGGAHKDNNLRLIDTIQYLIQNDFHNFQYLTNEGASPITDFTDHYQCCNIICCNLNM